VAWSDYSNWGPRELAYAISDDGRRLFINYEFPRNTIFVGKPGAVDMEPDPYGRTTEGEEFAITSAMMGAQHRDRPAPP
jgi:hypothetical protein